MKTVFCQRYWKHCMHDSVDECYCSFSVDTTGGVTNDNAILYPFLIAPRTHFMYTYPRHLLRMDSSYVEVGRESLDTQTMLIVGSISGLVLIIGLVIIIRSRETKRFNREVPATVTHVEVEASSVSSWWTISAVWSDPQTSQTLTFHSPHLQYPPKQHIGESIIVRYDVTKPKHYQMEL